MKARKGQVAVYLALALLAIVMLTLMNVGAYLAVSAKNRTMNAGDAAALVKAVEEYRADWRNRDEYFAAARAFFERNLSLGVVKAQLAGILERILG